MIYFYASSAFYKRKQLQEKDIYEFVSGSDKDYVNEHLLFAEKEVSDKDFDAFVRYVLNDNRGINGDFTQHYVVHYIKWENKKEYICDLVHLKVMLDSDSSLSRNCSIFSDVDQALDKLCDENPGAECCQY